MNPDSNNKEKLSFEKEEQPEKTVSQPTKPIVASNLRKRKSFKWHGVFLSILSLILVVISLIFFWLWWEERENSQRLEEMLNQSRQSSSESVNVEEQPAEECNDGWIRYENTMLGIGFCYPESWGEVSTQDARFDPDSDPGSRWRISFAEKSMVDLGVMSHDWSSSAGTDRYCGDAIGVRQSDIAALPQYSAEWTVEGEGESYTAYRDLIERGSNIAIIETTNAVYGGMICIEGLKMIENETYPVARTAYGIARSEALPLDPPTYVSDPSQYVSEEDRNSFVEFTQSIYSL